MAIDISRETLIPVTKAPLPGHSATKWRWAMRGVKGVRLETALVGGQRFTTAAACARFVAALNDQPAPVVPTNTSADDAGAKLAAMGAAIHQPPATGAQALLAPLCHAQSFYLGLPALAAARGLDADAPKNLAKVTRTI